MKTSLKFLILSLFAASTAAADAQIVIDKYVHLTGTHAAALDAVLRALPIPRISAMVQQKVFSSRVDAGKPVYWLLGENVGSVSGLNDPKLNQIGPAFGIAGEGTIFIRGPIALALAERGPSVGWGGLFGCQTRRNPGSVGFPGTVTAQCAIVK